MMTVRAYRFHVVGAALWLLGVCLMSTGCGGDDNDAPPNGTDYSTLNYPAVEVIPLS